MSTLYFSTMFQLGVSFVKLCYARHERSETTVLTLRKSDAVTSYKDAQGRTLLVFVWCSNLWDTTSVEVCPEREDAGHNYATSNDSVVCYEQPKVCHAEYASTMIRDIQNASLVIGQATLILPETREVLFVWVSRSMMQLRRYDLHPDPEFWYGSSEADAEFSVPRNVGDVIVERMFKHNC